MPEKKGGPVNKAGSEEDGAGGEEGHEREKEMAPVMEEEAVRNERITEEAMAARREEAIETEAEKVLMGKGRKETPVDDSGVV